MKIKTITKIALFVFGISIVVAFGDKGGLKKSNVTGWKYDKDFGFTSEGSSVIKSAVPFGMVAIEGGTFAFGQNAELTSTTVDNRQRNVTVSSFYMDQYEIRNIDWREYTTWMKIVFDSVAPDLVLKSQPDVNVWREAMAYNEPYLQNYFSHPAFDQYPVVGVTWEQAMDYCAWRTDRVNELALVQAKVISEPDFTQLNGLSIDSIRNDFVFNTQKYLLQASYIPTVGEKPKVNINGVERKVEMSDGILFSDFRLPTEAEWEFAAKGIKADKSGMVSQGKLYPWPGAQMRNPTKKQLGQMQANFVRGRGDMMGTSGSLNDNATITSKVDAYFPNDFGLYNMAGNVNEWVLDVYRSTTSTVTSEYNPFRGNEYVTLDTVAMVNNRPIYKINPLGGITKYIKSEDDKRDFKDGDLESMINFDLDSTKMLLDDSLDITDKLRPQITKTTRVYKGGSWKDRVYWLNPTTRRYLDQSRSANDIGFRCAMSMIGANDKVKKRK